MPICACAQKNNDRTHLGKQHSEDMLRITLADSSQHNVIKNNNIVIKDSLTAIAVAEPILFGIYGKENIIDQRPYDCYLIDNYWVINGTLPKNTLGGTFLIIFDARNCKILKITHGK